MYPFKDNHMQRPKLHGSLREQENNPIIEAIDWVCASVQDNHHWISWFSLVLQESKILGALECDIYVPCVVQWELLWDSSPRAV